MNHMKKQEIISYKEAITECIKYYDGDSLSAKVFLDKYALRNEKGELLEDSPIKMHRRLAKEFARVEAKKFATPLTEDEIFNLFDRFKYIVPQGSPMFGIGNNHQIISLSNCFVCDSPTDSYGGILKVDQQLVQISKRRGGVGTDLSLLRPNGSPTKNAAKSSTGVVSWAERYSNSIREVGQSGRRGALMLTISVHHPEIMAYATMKNDDSKVTGANISIRLSDEFLKAVEEDTDYELRFPVDSPTPKISAMIKAREVWETIIHSAWLRAEPGLLFWDRITNYNAVDCYEAFGFKSKATNPCSEIPLPAFDSCRLMVQNFFSYVLNPFTDDARFDFDLFYQHTKIAQRLMDDLIDLEIEKVDAILEKVYSDPEPDDIKREEIYIWTRVKEMAQNGRRTGLGGTGIGDMLAALGIKYGSEESIKFVDSVQKQFKLASYESSMEMAKEIGAFPVWNWDIEKKSPFLLAIKGENLELYNNIAKYGRRNIANLTFAPTGSVSIMTQTSSGCEPIFNLSYTRRKKVNPNDENIRVDFVDPNGDSWQEFTVYHPKVKNWMEVTGETDLTKSPWHGATAEEINWINRVKLQATMQKHIDHAISSTINLPEDVSEDVVAQIYTEAWKSGCKGITVYRKNCRTGVLVEAPKEQGDKITKTVAPKRGEVLSGELHHFTLKGQRYYVAVGIYNGEVYEVFSAMNHDSDGEIVIPKDIKHGQIIKAKKSKYFFSSEIGKWDLTNGHTDENVDALTRMISTALRHGTDVSFVVHQLEKTRGPLVSFAKFLARSLKKYIPDGTKVHGEECPECKGHNMIREDGCVKCADCAWTKCS
jgi:ribonucleoside-diphosphate reductase alpha chain